jgi:hypothetical protein
MYEDDEDFEDELDKINDEDSRKHMKILRNCSMLENPKIRR